MPNKDKTGPDGKGARTGRRLGVCKDADSTAGRGQGCFDNRCFRRRNIKTLDEKGLDA